MKTVVIISKPGRPQLPEVAARLVKWLKAHGYSVLADTDTCSALPGRECVAREKVARRDAELVAVLGGDGMVLAAGRGGATAGNQVLGVHVGVPALKSELRE